MTSLFDAKGGPIWIKILQTGAEWHVDCIDMVEIETRCRIPILRAFGRIQWHVIPEPRMTLQGAAAWWIHCHDSRATCHIAGCKNSIRHIENRFSPYFTFVILNAVWALTSGGFRVVADTPVTVSICFITWVYSYKGEGTRIHCILWKWLWQSWQCMCIDNYHSDAVHSSLVVQSFGRAVRSDAVHVLHWQHKTELWVARKPRSRSVARFTTSPGSHVRRRVTRQSL